VPSQKTTKEKASRRPIGLQWRRFSYERSTKAARTFLDGNFVSLSVPRGSTYRFAVEEIARKASRPIPVESLCDELSARSYIRGAVFFGNPGDKLDQITANYVDMQWWVSDKGLNVAILPPEMPTLSRFDELAGRLIVEHSKEGKLSKDALYEIAKALDQANFSLSEDLQGAQWRPIQQHNIKYSKNAIKTFWEAVRKPAFVRSIRRRLYVSRARFEKAIQQRAKSSLVG
jgi:hypothetical protein